MIPTKNQRELFERSLNGITADDLQISGNHYKEMPVQP